MEAEKKRPLDIDYSKLFHRKDKDDELVVVPAAQTPSSSSSSSGQHYKDMCRKLAENELKEKISRHKFLLKTSAFSLPDKGAKLKENLKTLEAEQERRDQENQIIEKAENTVEQTPVTPSSFTKAFSRKIAFEDEFKCLGKSNHQSKQINKTENGVASRQLLIKCDGHLSRDKDARLPSNGVQKQKSITSKKFYSSSLQDGDESDDFAKRRKTSQHQTSPKPRKSKVETVVDVDEDDDCRPIETVQRQDQCLGRSKDSKIYYPSRLEPDVEICYSDIDCLAPEAYLSSPIMNFYIRYLQRPVSATGKSRADYHFFNTYFYEKLKKAVADKSDTRATFAKLRRWWKGVSIFQKAYLFVPIHENAHWSLVIICIPDREDESGPIILHLDSYGCHDARQIFLNIKWLLIEEWNYINRESSQVSTPPDIPIADKIWKNLSRRVEDQRITVPQQKNEYDCGIFVLYFMERFIEEAHDRLVKKDLVLQFGRKWFKPEEASGLRERIRTLLLEEFQNADIGSDSGKSSTASSDADDSTECSVQPTEDGDDSPVCEVQTINS